MTNTSLRPNQRLAIAALIETGQVTDAAAAANVSRDSIHRWLKDDAFLAALREAEADALRALSRSLVALSNKATATIEAVMTDDETTAAVKLRAADVALSRLLAVRELLDLEERVTSLEARLEGLNDGMP
jgi:hypothetical protein